MKSFIFFCLVASSLSGLNPSNLLGLKVKVINDSPSNIQVFFRGEKANRHHVETLAAKTTGQYELSPDVLENKEFMEIIGSTGNQGSPDWKLLGGTCKHLSAKKDHTIVIEDTLFGLKTGCITIE